VFEVGLSDCIANGDHPLSISTDSESLEVEDVCPGALVCYATVAEFLPIHDLASDFCYSDDRVELGGAHPGCWRDIPDTAVGVSYVHASIGGVRVIVSGRRTFQDSRGDDLVAIDFDDLELERSFGFCVVWTGHSYARTSHRNQQGKSGNSK